MVHPPNVFSSFTVRYRYKAAAAQNLIDSWEEMRMTGFNLSWYILDENRTSQTPMVSSSIQAWQSVQFVPFFRNNRDNLVKMVSLAIETRKKNMTWEQVTKKIVEEKYERNQGIESEYNNYKRIDQCVNSLYSLRIRTGLIKNINIGIAIPPDWTLQLREGFPEQKLPK